MAVEADRVIVALIGDTSNLDASVSRSANQFSRNMGDIERSATVAERAIVRSSGQSSNAIRNLSFQVGDIGTQLAGGSSPFLIIAQQGPQVTQALQDISASGANLGQVLRGIALPGFLAVLSVLAPLISNLLSGADAADKKKAAVDQLTKAIYDMAKASSAAIASGQREIYIAQAQASAYLQAAAAKREQIKATLQQRIVDARAAEATEAAAPAGFAIPGRGAASRGAQVRQLERDLAAQDRAVTTAQTNVRRTQARVSQQLVTEALDPVAAATGRYERRVDALNRRVEADTISQTKYRNALLELGRIRDREIASANKGTEATTRGTRANSGAAASTRAVAAAQREAAREASQLRSRLESIERQLDPTGAAAKDFAGDLQAIKDGVEQNIITPARAAELQLLAMRKALEPVAGAFVAAVPGVRTAGERLGKGSGEAVGDAAEDQLRSAEDNIQDLADLYQTLFTGGTKGLWDEFKRQGLQALALLAAQETFKAITGKDAPIGGGGSGGLLGLVGSFFGRASGGSVGPNSIHRVNEGGGGVELLRMGSKGGEIIPLGRTRAVAPASGGNRVYNITVSADNSVTPAGFARDLASQILTEAKRMDAQTAQATLRSVPGAQQRRNQLGTN